MASSSSDDRLSTIEAAFGAGKSLYEVLEIPRDASAARIKKAYYKKALKYHPDRNRDPGATATFQALSLVHTTLSDPAKRKIYDETGVVEDEDGLSSDGRAMYEYWRRMFPPVTAEAIEQFEGTYVGSDEERRDVLEAYARHGAKANFLAKMVEEIMFSDLGGGDDARFGGMIGAAVDAGDAPLLAGFAAWRKKQQAGGGAKGKGKGKRKRKGPGKKAQREAAEAAELAKLLGLNAKRRAGGGGGGAGAGAGAGAGHPLQQQITKRQREFESVTAAIEAKYCKKKKKGGGKGKKKKVEAPEPPSDEEFARIQAAMLKRAGRK